MGKTFTDSDKFDLGERLLVSYAATATKKISRGDAESTEAEETKDHGADWTMTGTAGVTVISYEDAQDHGAEAAREEMGES